MNQILNTEEVQLIIASRFHSGPLPDPSTLHEYNRLIDNGAERIMRMAEQEQKNRFKQEEQKMNAYSRGQIFAFSSIILLVTFAFILVYFGSSSGAVTLLLGTIVSITGTFVIGKKMENKDK